MSAILRKRVRNNFVQIPNSTVRDRSLSFKAVGVLAHILSLPDGSQISAETLAEAHSEGKAAVGTALQELKREGYYRVDRKRSSAGTFIMEVVVSNRPDLDEPIKGEIEPTTDYRGSDEPTSDYPTPVEPTSDEPTSDNRSPSNKDLSTKKNNKDLSTKTKNKESGQLFEPSPELTNEDLPRLLYGFDAFWDRWPECSRLARTEASRSWKFARNRSSEVEILQAVDAWSVFWRESETETQFIPRPGKWLERGMHKDAPPSVPIGPKAAPDGVVYV